MIIKHGNLWDFHHMGPVCITTNGVIKANGELVMGAGIARQAKERYPLLPRKIAEAVQLYGNNTYYFPDENIFSFPTKNHWKDKSDIELIIKSAHQLIDLMNSMHIPRVYMTKPGCGNGGLDWQTVSPILMKIFSDSRFVVVL